MEKVSAFTAIFSTVIMFVVILVIGYFVNKRYGKPKKTGYTFSDYDPISNPYDPTSPLYHHRDHPG